jgi:type II secretory pathway pseudopilin PulG
MTLLVRHLPVSIILGAVAAAAYLLGCVRRRGTDFTLLDGFMLVAIMGVGTAIAMPVLNAAGERANTGVLRENLRILRGQIELYKIEHGGAVPLLHEGTFPQLVHTTNAQGVPGPAGKKYPYGPYLPGGIPANPFTGVSTVTLTEESPPTQASNVGGWLYHQETGRIVPDLADRLLD